MAGFAVCREVPSMIGSANGVKIYKMMKKWEAFFEGLYTVEAETEDEAKQKVAAEIMEDIKKDRIIIWEAAVKS